FLNLTKAVRLIAPQHTDLHLAQLEEAVWMYLRSVGRELEERALVKASEEDAQMRELIRLRERGDEGLAEEEELDILGLDKKEDDGVDE
ncbi:hypothetical protein HK101_002299, partial [Irineochytrium annulatum]